MNMYYFMNSIGVGDFCHAAVVFNHFKVKYINVYSQFNRLTKILIPSAENIVNDNSGKIIWPQSPATFRCHLTDYCALTGFDANLEPDEKSFNTSIKSGSDFKLPDKKYVLIYPYFTSFVREMSIDVFNAIKWWCIKNDILPVICGSTEKIPNHIAYMYPMHPYGMDTSDCLDLTNKLELHDIIHLAQNALTFVGVDNGLMHLSSFSETHGIWGFTSVLPKRRLPYRHGVLGWNTTVIEPKSRCRYCQEKVLYQHDFKTCFNGNRECVFELDPKDFVAALEKLL
jgi:ADP-heptose:LPS heptosyltransferase